jgi:hypothetical protein
MAAPTRRGLFPLKNASVVSHITLIDATAGPRKNRGCNTRMTLFGLIAAYWQRQEST